jgi:hypothetical protein
MTFTSTPRCLAAIKASAISAMGKTEGLDQNLGTGIIDSIRNQFSRILSRRESNLHRAGSGQDWRWLAIGRRFKRCGRGCQKYGKAAGQILLHGGARHHV